MRLVAEIFQPRLFAHLTRLSTNPGAAAISCLAPVTTAGMISATSPITARNTNTKIKPVALPRRHPLAANQFTPGSSANDRKNAVKMMPKKLVSLPASPITASAVTAPTTITTMPRIVSLRRSAGAHGGSSDPFPPTVPPRSGWSTGTVTP